MVWRLTKLERYASNSIEFSGIFTEKIKKILEYRTFTSSKIFFYVTNNLFALFLA